MISKANQLIKRFANFAFISVFLTVTGPVSGATLLEEVVVTAQKREQDLQDVGISVTAFTGDALRDLGITDSVGISAQTPGMEYGAEHVGAGIQITIRGISQRDFADHHEPPIATYVDGAYVSTPGASHVQLYDIERVEVLRGPQGTLFGRNSTGGLLHFVSKKPSEEFDAYGEVTVAEYDEIKFEGAVGGAITDNLLGRLSVATHHNDGWLKNRIGPDLNDRGTWSVRGQLLFDIAENTSVHLKLHHAEDDSEGSSFTSFPSVYDSNGLGNLVGRNELAVFDLGGGPFTTCAGCDGYFFRNSDDDLPRAGSFGNPGKFNRGITGMTGTITMDIRDGLTLTSVTDYLHLNKNLGQDVDGGPVNNIEFFYDQDLDQVSQELRLNGVTDRLNWIVGLYYLDIDTYTNSGVLNLNVAPIFGVPGAFFPFSSEFRADTESESWAVFGHLEYAINDQWSVTAALRYTEDERESDYVVTDDFGSQAFNAQVAPNAKIAFENISARVGLDWKPTDDTLVYVSYNRGHKAGSYNYPFIVFGPIDFATMTHDEEEVDSYEIGIKTALLGGRARLNATAFYYDYSDFQASFFENLANIVGNVDAEVLGAEIELSMSVTERLELLLGASLLDAETKDLGMPDGSLQDRPMSEAPDFTLNGLARYTFPLASGASVALQMDFNYSDNYCSSAICHPSEEIGSYIVGNAKASYTTADEHWTVSAFVRNLADEFHPVGRGDSSFVSFATLTHSPPRWFGGSVAFQY